jgi:hypothetical protein
LPLQSNSGRHPTPLFWYLIFFGSSRSTQDVDLTGNITAKICEVLSEFNIFCILVTMAMATILNLFNPLKLPHTMVDIPTKFHEV